MVFTLLFHFIFISLLLFISYEPTLFSYSPLFLFLGTASHEMMHFLIGFILQADPIEWTLTPILHPDGSYTLGSVGFSNLHFWNAAPTALAPLLLLTLIIPLFKLALFFAQSLFWCALFSFLNANLLFAFFPSETDWARSFPSLLFYAPFFIILISLYFRFKPSSHAQSKPKPFTR